ncbi:hypothetical protein DUI87_08601 [Hirundo rustica rustica]|uniref:RNA-directed DNA polymerase n=1 Tax=Hirundo rustica rustica TaxID=333673 RepID=A0A3M0KKE2_HIRRU|nr:hypothetical protein DUI87_08601 [Hirundo rustica rustica]
MLSAEEADTLQTLELFAVVWAISHFREPINVVTDSLYVAGVVARIEDAFIKEVRNQRLYQLLMQLNKALHQREQPYAVIHIRSHKWNIGLGEGNQRADELVSTAITVPLPQHVLAREAHSIFHQNAKGLQKEFHISHAEATAIVRSCPICCHHNGGLGLGTGVNPRGVMANELWQADVTHVNSFGRLKYVHVTIDTYSHYIWATPQSGEESLLESWIPPTEDQEELSEADANSRSSLCGQPRPAQARRRSWRQRAQASARQPGKPIRLNRVPLLRAETGSPGTASRGLPGLSQAVVPVSSSGGGGSFPCQKQSLKGRHAEGAAEPHTSKSLVAKCRRAEDVSDLGTETGTPSTASRGLPGLSPGVVLVGSSGGGGSSSGGFPCQRQSLKRRYPEGAAEPRAPESPAAKRRRIQDVPAQSAETGHSCSARRGVLRLAQDTQAPSRQAAPLWLFPGSRTDNRSQPGPIPMRHVWRQQRRAKKPYSRPENLSRARQTSAPGGFPRHPSK